MVDFALSTNDGRNSTGNRRSVVGVYTGPASYATGGDPLSASDVELSSIRSVVVGIAADANNENPRLVRWNAAQTKLMWYVPSTAAEVANAVDLSGFTCTLYAEGR